MSVSTAFLGMAFNFIECNRDQPFLMPPDLSEWLPEGHLAWFVIDAVEGMDLSEFLSSYRADGWGRAALHPRMMVALLVYGYCVGERSSRKLEKLCEDSIAFRVVSGNRKPDHTSIARFRKRHEVAITDLFTQVLSLCHRSGMVKVGLVAIDGTKMKANASLEANRSKTWLREQVVKMLSEADEMDALEDVQFGSSRGDELPKELRSREGRKALIKERLAELNSRPQPRGGGRESKAKAEASASNEKKAEPEPKAIPDPRINLTDPDSRILKARQGFVQGFNAQAAVSENHFVVAANLTRAANDVKELHPMLSAAKRNLRMIGVKEQIHTVLADAGYWSKLNARWEERCGTRLLIATRKVYRLRQLAKLHPPRGRMPKGLSLKAQMERRLLTQEGQALYKLRGQTVEPFFGTTKSARRCDRFMRRGWYACQSEWQLICATHNLTRLWRLGGGKV